MSGFLDRLWAALGKHQPAPEVLPETSPKPPANLPPADRFRACLAIVLHHEGGFANDPHDPGGATMMGITRETLAQWRGRQVTAAEVRAMPRSEAEAIYRAKYWDLMQCDQLPAGVDLVVFDFGVNAGPGRAARMLQNSLNVPADGLIGPITLRAAGKAEAGALIDRMSQWRVTYYRSLATFPRFGRGWLRRTEEVRQEARRMAGASSNKAV